MRNNNLRFAYVHIVYRILASGICMYMACYSDKIAMCAKGSPYLSLCFTFWFILGWQQFNI